jgi:exoribonuclease II
MNELAEEAKGTYGPGSDQVTDAAHLRFINELQHRLSRVVYQLLGEDPSRPGDDVVVRMLLSPRADKVAEKMVHAAYRRALQNFERYDTTVFMNS